MNRPPLTRQGTTIIEPVGLAPVIRELIKDNSSVRIKINDGKDKIKTVLLVISIVIAIIIAILKYFVYSPNDPWYVTMLDIGSFILSVGIAYISWRQLSEGALANLTAVVPDTILENDTKDMNRLKDRRNAVVEYKIKPMPEEEGKLTKIIKDIYNRGRNSLADIRHNMQHKKVLPGLSDDSKRKANTRPIIEDRKMSTLANIPDTTSIRNINIRNDDDSEFGF